MQTFSILSNEKHPLYGSEMQMSLMYLFGDIKSLNKNKFKYQRLWFKEEHLAEGENYTITYVPGCLPVEKQVMGNVHIQHRKKCKTI